MAQTRWGQQGVINNGFWTSLRRVPVLSLSVPSSSPTIVCGLPPVTGSITRNLAPSNPDQT